MSHSIALLGQPNSGKSTLFNGLTGARQHVGNWPGKTVEKCQGYFIFKGERIEVTDLPGSYSLEAKSLEEVITDDFIRGNEADLVLVLADSSQLSRSLYMLANFSQLNIPCILVLNMMDVAKNQGKTINCELLEERLGVPVVPFVAADLSGYNILKEAIVKELAAPRSLSCAPAKAGEEYTWIEELLKGVVEGKSGNYKLSKFDRISTGRISGKLLAFGIMVAAFIMSMVLAAPIMGLGSQIPAIFTPILSNIMGNLGVFPLVSQIVSVLIPNTIYFSLSMAGFVFGVNFVFSFLEDVGYIARIAYVFDGPMSRLGVTGKSVCSMLMGMGCTIGGASGARVIDDYGQRVLTIALTWTVPCAAIWSVVPVLAAIFFGSGAAFVMLGIVLYMVILMWVISLVFGKSLSPKENRKGMLMELPPYHKPHWKNILYVAWIRAQDIFVRALRTVFVISVIFFCFSFSPSGDIEGSLLYKIGILIEPVTRLFGLGWQTFMAFLASAFAKEAVLGVLNAVFTGQGSLLLGTFEAKTMGVNGDLLAQAMPMVISKAEALAFLFAVSFNVPCIMALSSTYRETHSLKWTARLAIFFTLSALVLAGIVYHVAGIFL